MTINLSSKGQSSGGILTTDPRELPSYLLTYGDVKIKWGTTGEHADIASTFWSYYGRAGGYVPYYDPDNGTYKTIINLTSDAGILYNLISPAHHSTSGTGEIKFKITVDGTEYILGPSIGTVRRSKRLVIGPLLPISPITSYGNSPPDNLGSYYDTGYNNYGGTSQPPLLSNGYLPPPSSSIAKGAGGLSFKKSLKCEVLVNISHGSNYYKWCGINYSSIKTW